MLTDPSSGLSSDCAAVRMTLTPTCWSNMNIDLHTAQSKSSEYWSDVLCIFALA